MHGDCILKKKDKVIEDAISIVLFPEEWYGCKDLKHINRASQR